MLAIGTRPASITVYQGDPAPFSGTVPAGSGRTPYTYQWTANGTNIMGATTSAWTKTSCLPSDNGAAIQYVATQTAGTSLTPAAAPLTVIEAPYPVTQPIGANKEVGNSHTFTIMVTGGVTPYDYQPRKGSRNSEFRIQNDNKMRHVAGGRSVHPLGETLHPD